MRYLVAALLLVAAHAAGANDIDELMGTWLSPDGAARQEFSAGFDGEWVDTRMWFMTSSGWKMVSQGAMYRKPGENAWRGVARAVDMGGIALFEFTIVKTSDTEFRSTNTAWMESGESLETEEVWQFDSENEWSYTVYFIENGKREPRVQGSWLRSE